MKILRKKRYNTAVTKNKIKSNPYRNLINYNSLSICLSIYLQELGLRLGQGQCIKGAVYLSAYKRVQARARGVYQGCCLSIYLLTRGSRLGQGECIKGAVYLYICLQEGLGWIHGSVSRELFHLGVRGVHGDSSI